MVRHLVRVLHKAHKTDQAGWCLIASRRLNCRILAQIYGFMFTTIAKGAFLIRASIIFTPLLCTVAGEAVPAGLWAGSLLGFAGSVMISLDPSHTSSGAPGASAAAGTSFIFYPQ